MCLPERFSSLLFSKRLPFASKISTFIGEELLKVNCNAPLFIENFSGLRHNRRQLYPNGSRKRIFAVSSGRVLHSLAHKGDNGIGYRLAVLFDTIPPKLIV